MPSDDSAETVRAAYETFETQLLVDLRWALIGDRKRPDVSPAAVAFCNSRIPLIESILADRVSAELAIERMKEQLAIVDAIVDEPTEPS